MQRTLCGLVLLFVLFSQTGCATILSGKSQTLTVETNPPGARCELLREGRIIGSVDSTPGALTVEKTKYDLSILCRKEGFVESKGFAESGTEGATFGNIILGGGIGWAIDSAAGADNKYPELITVNLAAAESKEAPGAIGMSDQISDQRERLERLKALHEGGLLGEEEYAKKRGEVLQTL